MQRSATAKADVGATVTTRRLTNFEYQNTMHDLLGFELKFADGLPPRSTARFRGREKSAARESFCLHAQRRGRAREKLRRQHRGDDGAAELKTEAGQNLPPQRPSRVA